MADLLNWPKNLRYHWKKASCSEPTHGSPINYQSVTLLYTLLGPAIRLLIHIRIPLHCELEKQSLLKKFSLKIPIASSDSVPEIALCLFNLISSTWSPLAFWAGCLLNPIAGVLNTEFGGAGYFLVDIVLPLILLHFCILF